MENHATLVWNQALRNLEPGMRFCPTDEELVVSYLIRKIVGAPLPTGVILEANVCKVDPWNLPGYENQVRYFFSHNDMKNQSGKRCNRATESGYWKGYGTVHKVMLSGINRGEIGLKKTFVFYQGKGKNGTRTNWVMHEYRVASGSTACEMLMRRFGATNGGVALANRLENIVLSSISKNKRSCNDGGADHHHAVPRAAERQVSYDLNDDAPTSSSDTSEILDEPVTDSDEDNQTKFN